MVGIQKYYHLPLVSIHGRLHSGEDPGMGHHRRRVGQVLGVTRKRRAVGVRLVVVVVHFSDPETKFQRRKV